MSFLRGHKYSFEGKPITTEQNTAANVHGNIDEKDTSLALRRQGTSNDAITTAPLRLKSFK